MAHDEEFTAWACLHTPDLLRRATLLCGDRHQAEDLVQETLVRMFLRWSRIDLDQSPTGYASTTLFRVFLAGRRRRSAGELPSWSVPERPARPADLDLRLDLLAALQTLPARQRCVVVARYLDDRPVSEVATLMRRSEGWVRVTALRALRSLRDSPLVATSTSGARLTTPNA